MNGNDTIMTEERDQTAPDIEAALFEFLSRKYVQRQDERQRSMGLIYMEAETHNLARELARFMESLS